jgi:hypothetical protein
MPPSVRCKLVEAGLVISKGDANYRRLLGDLHWADTTPFASVVAYFPTRLLALRTSKSVAIVGLRPGQAGDLNHKESAWQTNGRWGLVQLRR